MNGIDTPCEQCAATMCTDQALDCAAASTCEPDGTPTAGCLAVIECAVANCSPTFDLGCIVSACGEEVGSCDSACQSAAQALGDCVQANCSADCGAGAGGAAP